jgi:hypothetical protein
MHLDATTKSIEVDLAGAVATNQLEITVHYDQYTSLFRLDAIAEAATVTNNTTAVTALAAPAATKIRHLRLLTVYNADTVPATATVQINDGGTIRRVMAQLLQPGETLVYAS